MEESFAEPLTFGSSLPSCRIRSTLEPTLRSRACMLDNTKEIHSRVSEVHCTICCKGWKVSRGTKVQTWSSLVTDTHWEQDLGQSDRTVGGRTDGRTSTTNNSWSLPAHTKRNTIRVHLLLCSFFAFPTTTTQWTSSYWSEFAAEGGFCCSNKSYFRSVVLLSLASLFALCCLLHGIFIKTHEIIWNYWCNYSANEAPKCQDFYCSRICCTCIVIDYWPQYVTSFEVSCLVVSRLEHKTTMELVKWPYMWLFMESCEGNKNVWCEGTLIIEKKSWCIKSDLHIMFREVKTNNLPIILLILWGRHVHKIT